MAGYSATPLPKKLGISEGARLLVIGEPPEFQAALGPLPDSVERTSSMAGRKPFDTAILFVRNRTDIERPFARIAARMTDAGGIWIAWPKKTSGIATDVSEQTLRDVLLPTGWVDNKVCAIDERWSGLRFVLRKELRTVARKAPARRKKRG